MPVWVVVVYSLAVTRIAGLICCDDITKPARTFVLARLPLTRAGRLVTTWITCPWCNSVWIAAAVAPVAIWWPTQPWALWPAAALAFSQITGMLADIGRS